MEGKLMALRHGMPWITRLFENEWGSIVYDENPGPVAGTVEERVRLDFLNMIRVAMTYPEEEVREMYPVDAEDPLDQVGNRIINDKYDLVVEYMRTTYGINLQRYAEILDE